MYDKKILNNYAHNTPKTSTTHKVISGYMADYESSSQEDVPQYGGDEAIKVWSFDLQPDIISSSSHTFITTWQTQTLVGNSNWTSVPSCTAVHLRSLQSPAQPLRNGRCDTGKTLEKYRG